MDNEDKLARENEKYESVAGEALSSCSADRVPPFPSSAPPHVQLAKASSPSNFPSPIVWTARTQRCSPQRQIQKEACPPAEHNHAITGVEPAAKLFPLSLLHFARHGQPERAAPALCVFSLLEMGNSHRTLTWPLSSPHGVMPLHSRTAGAGQTVETRRSVTVWPSSRRARLMSFDGVLSLFGSIASGLGRLHGTTTAWSPSQTSPCGLGRQGELWPGGDSSITPACLVDGGRLTKRGSSFSALFFRGPFVWLGPRIYHPNFSTSISTDTPSALFRAAVFLTSRFSPSGPDTVTAACLL